MTSREHKPTRNQQREEARAKAKVLREQHKKGERRKRLRVQIGVIGSILVAVGVIVFALVSGSSSPASAATPKNLTFDGGVKIGAGLQAYTASSTPTPTSTTAATTNIVVYLDYQCPICKFFELANASQIKNWVSTGVATLEIRPLSFLDGRGTPNEYSSRAANAAICVAEYAPNSFFDYNALLFENQPEEGTAGPENDELIDNLSKVSITSNDDLIDCIDNKTFGQWISTHTSKVLSTPISGTKEAVDGTPYILVNGQRYTWTTGEELQSPARFAQFVQTVGAK